ncbi:unnamed protein product [Arctogadus glacialis]
MLGPQLDRNRPVPPMDVSNGNHCQMGASDRGLDEVCLYQTAACTLYSEAHTPTPLRATASANTNANASAGSHAVLRTHTADHGVQQGCSHPEVEMPSLEHKVLDRGSRGACGRNRGSITRSSEGYGTEEECVLSDPQGESDADADIEDTDCRLQEPGSLQRISSRRRKRPRPTRQDTTESEDDGGRSQRTTHWNPRLSPHRGHSRTILEESVSQVRPLVIRRPSAEVQTAGSPEASGGPKPAMWPSAPRLPPRLLLLLFLLLLPLSLVLLLLFRPWAGA